MIVKKSHIEAVFQIGGRFLLEEASRVVETAQLTQLDWPPGAVSVRFDVVVAKVATVDGETFGKTERTKGPTIWCGELQSLEDVIEEQGADSVLASNMKANGWPAVVKTWAGTYPLDVRDEVVAP